MRSHNPALKERVPVYGSESSRAVIWNKTDSHENASTILDATIFPGQGNVGNMFLSSSPLFPARDPFEFGRLLFQVRDSYSVSTKESPGPGKSLKIMGPLQSSAFSPWSSLLYFVF